MKKIYSLLLLLFAATGLLKAQTTVTTGVPNSASSLSGTTPAISFIIENTNSYDVIITDLATYRASNSSGLTYTLWYNATSLSGSSNLNTTPGWTTITAVTASTVTTTAIHPTFSGLNFVLPANTTYRFAVQSSGSNINYGGATTVPNSFTGGGIIIGTGNYQINGMNVGYAGGSGSLTTNPRFFGGTVTFAAATPCVNPPTAGTATASNMFPCAGASVQLGLTGGTGGQGQTYQWESSASASGPFTPVGASQTAALLTVNPTATTYYRATVTCGGNTSQSSPVLITVPAPFPGGTCTINNLQPTGGTNFQTFQDAAAAINCGITGPVVFNVSNGPYNNDFFHLDHYIAATGAYPITINGNGAVLSNLSNSASEPAIIRLSGAKHVTIDNLNIQGISTSTSQYAWGIFLTNNADSNTITNSTITLDTTATSTNYAGIVVSGGAAGATTAASNSDGLLISNNTINGGYYGITLMGTTTAGILQNNVITNNTLRNFYLYGIYSSYSNNMLIEDNDISRPSRTAVSTFGGIYLPTGHTGLKVSRNRIHNLATSAPSASFTMYGVYLTGSSPTVANANLISNNILYNLEGIGTHYYFYNNASGNTRYYHNSISSDETGVTATGITYALYTTGTAANIEFKNNNVSITRGGTAAKYGIYITTNNAVVASQNNNFYINGGNGSNNVGYINTVAQASLMDWQTASSQDSTSLTVDPIYLSPSLGNLLPTNGQLDNMGLPVAGVTTDIAGAPRSVTTPDIGAYEFTVTACTGQPTAGLASGPAAACPSQSFNVSLTGFTIGTGITIQWQSSVPGSSVWNNITGATSPLYVESAGITSPTEYRALVTCSNGGNTDISNVVYVGLNSFMNCYCIPTNAGGTAITNITIPGTTFNNTTGAAPAPNYYISYPPVGSTTATLYTGTNYTVNLTFATTAIGSVWIDYNQNGIFETTEWVQTGTTGTAHTATIAVPATALTGQTGMRFRSRGAGNINGAPDACLAMGGGETEDYIITIAPPAACIPPAGFASSNISPTSADLSWGPVSNAVGYEMHVSTSITPPASGTPVSGTSTTSGPLSPATTYYVHLRTDCGASGLSAWATYSFQSGLVNDNAPGAIPVTVGGGCTGNPYLNTGATQSANEPYPGCAGTGGYHTVWYSFVAPATGAVKITTDFTGGTMGTDSRLALYSATNVNDYTTFTQVACDDDNGSVVGTRSIVYAAGLVPSATYYIQVDEFDPVTQPASSFPGTFCLEVHELSSTMLAASGNCATGQAYSLNAGYMGWNSLVDNSGHLIANYKDNNGSGGAYNVAITKNSSAVRQAPSGLYYLDRNYLINGATTGNVDVQFFFTNAELTALQSVVPSATLGSLNVTRQSGAACQANFNAANGTNSFLPQSANGTANNAHWISVNSPGFSNFYIMAGNHPLAIQLAKISAVNMGNRNRVDWNSASEHHGDYFILERSADGRNFTALSTIAAKGTASAYGYWDEQPFGGTNYYRIRMMDAGGSQSYSEVVTAVVKGHGAFAVEASPNPVGDVLTIKVYGSDGKNAQVIVTDVTGKLLSQSVVETHTTTIRMAGFAPGVYFVKYTDADHSETIKVNKQ